MYFMQEAGEPLRLTFKKAPYGPYAENLRHVLKVIEGYLIAGYADGRDTPLKQLNLVPGAAETATDFLRQQPETHARFDRVAELVDGFESPFGLELLSTVHWVIKRTAASSMEEVIRHVYAWNKRKQQFSHRQIMLAGELLFQKGWTKAVCVNALSLKNITI
jgi:hypothetical protein